MRAQLNTSCMLLFLLVLTIVNVVRSDNIVSSINHQMDADYPLSILFNNKYGRSTKKPYFTKKTPTILTPNEKLIIEKKIKENLMERLKSLHASSMTLR